MTQLSKLNALIAAAKAARITYVHEGQVLCDGCDEPDDGLPCKCELRAEPVSIADCIARHVATGRANFPNPTQEIAA